jgi:hypothetical protein
MKATAPVTLLQHAWQAGASSQSYQQIVLYLGDCGKTGNHNGQNSAWKNQLFKSRLHDTSALYLLLQITAAAHTSLLPAHTTINTMSYFNTCSLLSHCRGMARKPEHLAAAKQYAKQ